MYVFSLVYFSAEVCLVGVFTHSVSIWSDPCVRACVPPPPPPVTKIISYKGWLGSLLEPIEGAFLTDARVRLHYWMVIWVAGYCNPLILHSFWGVSWAGYIWPAGRSAGSVLDILLPPITTPLCKSAHRRWKLVNASRVYLVEVCLTCC